VAKSEILYRPGEHCAYSKISAFDESSTTFEQCAQVKEESGEIEEKCRHLVYSASGLPGATGSSGSSECSVDPTVQVTSQDGKLFKEYRKKLFIIYFFSERHICLKSCCI
jgi:hypothetical protein